MYKETYNTTLSKFRCEISIAMSY